MKIDSVLLPYQKNAEQDCVARKARVKQNHTFAKRVCKKSRTDFLQGRAI